VAGAALGRAVANKVVDTMAPDAME